jgi:hypothetical protein
VNLHRKSLEEYFLIYEDITNLGRLMAVTQPFESPIFESRLQPGLHPHAIKTIFFEVISTVMKHEFMDENLPSTPGHTYGHVIEDIVALILVANCGFCIPAPKPNDPITEEVLLVLAQTILQYEKMHGRSSSGECTFSTRAFC